MSTNSNVVDAIIGSQVSISEISSDEVVRLWRKTISVCSRALDYASEINFRALSKEFPAISFPYDLGERLHAHSLCAIITQWKKETDAKQCFLIMSLDVNAQTANLHIGTWSTKEGVTGITAFLASDEDLKALMDDELIRKGVLFSQLEMFFTNMMNRAERIIEGNSKLKNILEGVNYLA